MYKKSLIIILCIISIVLSGCSNKYSRENALSNKVKVGDYILLESDTDNYVITKDKSGYDKDQTINTNDLKLWRVIKINSDLTVDVVSEYLPHDEIIISGLTGYKNNITLLNEIAKEYGNKKYIEKARNTGYSKQEENIDEIKSFNTLMSKSWNEIKKADYIETALYLSTDEGYKNDIELINKAIGTIQASPESTREHSYNGYFRYLISSRDAYYSSVSKNIQLYIREIDGEGKISNTTLYDCSDMNSNGCESIPTVSERIRPILTLKHNIFIDSGDGSKDSPYKVVIN